MINDKKIAIVYDWIDKWGGVERILLTLHEMFPKADFYTSYYDPEKASWAKKLNIKTSFIQKLPKLIKKNRLLSFFLYPYAFESFDFSSYNLVISVTSSFAKTIITKPGTVHLCYLLTPTRYLWVYPELYFNNKLFTFIKACLINKIKKWDFIASQRPDKIISISKTVANRCRKYYQRESEVTYPPFDTNYWEKIKFIKQDSQFTINLKFRFIHSKKYFLVVSRLEPYKRIDLVIQSFNQLDNYLIIVGEGSQEKKLRAISGKNIYFLKRLSDQELASLYNYAQALIISQEEDFGYISLEAQFLGCPVIAYKKGGSSETVVDNRTGIFFNKQTKESLSDAIERFQTISYNFKEEFKEQAALNIRKFDKERFIKNFMQLTI